MPADGWKLQPSHAGESRLEEGVGPGPSPGKSRSANPRALTHKETLCSHLPLPKNRSIKRQLEVLGTSRWQWGRGALPDRVGQDQAQFRRHGGVSGPPPTLRPQGQPAQVGGGCGEGTPNVAGLSGKGIRMDCPLNHGRVTQLLSPQPARKGWLREKSRGPCPTARPRHLKSKGRGQRGDPAGPSTEGALLCSERPHLESQEPGWEKGP